MNRFLPFEAIAAFRFMREGISQTMLIVLGVALGVGVIVFMSALISGLQSNIIRRTLNSVAPIVIIPLEQVARPQRKDEPGALAENVQPRSQQLRSIDQWQKVRTQAVTITGIESDTYVRVIALEEKIVAGRLPAGASDIVIGIELSKDLGAGVGDKLRLTTASGGTETLNVVGLFDFGNKAVNSRSVYIGLRVAQNLLNLSGGVSSIEVKVHEPFEAENIAQRIQSETGLQADSWIKTNAQFFTAMAAQSLSNTVIRFFVGLTAALGIASVLVVSVVQKSKEIGILRAMGTSRAQVLRVFLVQGGVMGLVGSLFGCGLGWSFLAIWRGVALNPDGTPLFIIEIAPELFLLAAAGATLVGVLAAVVPARRAARLDPAIAIRG
ncbi:MAG: ABC transporter permease [Proteobacteria bacterium]|nr:ABC transporter permease [Pseudomonadota bacterium]